MSARDTVGELVQAAGRRALPPREDYEYVLAAARTAWQQKLRARQRRRVSLALAASILIVAAVSGVLFYSLPRTGGAAVAYPQVLRGVVAQRSVRDGTWRPLELGTGIAPGSVLRTADPAGVALELSSGVLIRLARATEVELQSARAIRLVTGTVYVDSGGVASGGSIRIETPMGTVSDVGTVFEVRSVPQMLRVRVREGRVRVNDRPQGADIESAAGEQLDISQHGDVRRSRFPASSPDWGWAEALAAPVDVEGRSLLQFLSWVSRETGRRLQFEGSDVEAQAREVVLHGKAENLAPLQALELMMATTDLEFTLPTDEVIVIRKRQP
jgi:ferric-dicitrate binding protein FerR (iron transport regulator)